MAKTVKIEPWIWNVNSDFSIEKLKIIAHLTSQIHTLNSIAEKNMHFFVNNYVYNMPEMVTFCNSEFNPPYASDPPCEFDIPYVVISNKKLDLDYLQCKIVDILFTHHSRFCYPNQVKLIYHENKIITLTKLINN